MLSSSVSHGTCIPDEDHAAKNIEKKWATLIICSKVLRVPLGLQAVKPLSEIHRLCTGGHTGQALSNRHSNDVAFEKLCSF